MDLERAIKLDPKNPEHHVAMSQLLMHNLLAAEKVLGAREQGRTH
jgi:hypothetical protein